MEDKSAKEIRNAINHNIETIVDLFHSAQEMQKSIEKLQDEADQTLMTENFNSVVECINQLMKGTNKLFDMLESFMEE